MQIRIMDLKELDSAYTLVKELYTDMSYEAFEDAVYEMKKENYTMIGAFERGEIVGYAGVKIATSLKHGRHLIVYEFTTLQESQALDEELFSYLRDFAKMGMCQALLYVQDPGRKLSCESFWVEKL